VTKVFMKKPLFYKVLSYFIVIGLLVGALVAFFLYLKGEWRFEYDVQLTNLEICQFSLASNSYQLVESKIVSQDIDNIFICGTLQTSSKVPLVIIVFNQDEDKLAFIEGKERYESGNFNVKIDFLNGTKLGNYNIKVYFHRNLLAEQEFTITEE